MAKATTKAMIGGLEVEVRKDFYLGLWNIKYTDASGQRYAGPFKTKKEAVERLADARAAELLKHTPGPWDYGFSGRKMREGYSQPLEIHQSGQPNLIAGAFGDVRGGEAVAEANARLIAAAPDLLAALKALMEIATSSGSETAKAAWAAAFAAIEKAEGRA